MATEPSEKRQPRSDPDVEWLRCPECRIKLAKKIGKGRYESIFVISRKNDDGSRQKIRQEMVIGAIYCPKCSHRLTIPLSALES